MRILIVANKVPYIWGGAEIHIQNLFQQLESRGYEVDVMYIPFTYLPENEIYNIMEFATKINCETFNGMVVDKVISLQFPSYYVEHSNKVVWLIHQHRPVYDLYKAEEASDTTKKLRSNIIKNDLKFLPKAKKIFTISHNVTNRLLNNNSIGSEALYHPPLGEEHFYCYEDYGYIFYPSRLETLKRQDLLINAMKYTRTPIKVIITGDGGQKENFCSLIDGEISKKITIIDAISIENRELLYALYARSLGVFFGPYDEDYGYITLEAMLSSKPVLTCNDSGGPLEFVIDGETGLIVEPDPKKIAEKIDWLYENKNKAKEMGIKGRKHYYNKNISWDNVIEKLLEG